MVNDWDSLWFRFWFGRRLTRDAMWRWLAWHLPRPLVLWCMVRVAAHASMGQYGNTSPDQLTYDLMHQRWEAIDDE
jgi:hypothetical protein